MRLMVAGPGRQGLPGTILAFFYLYFLLHWGTGILMFGEKIGFSYAAVVRYYLGDPELFMNPRSFQGLIEVTHFHLFAMGLYFVVFSHLLLFSPYRLSLKGALTWLLAAAIAGDLASGYLVRYVAPSFAWIKLGSFWLLQGVSLALLIGLVAGMFKREQAGG